MSFDSFKNINPLGAAKDSLGKAKDLGSKTVQKFSSQDEPDYPDVFDTIIIGAGPAGMTAAVYAARRKLKILLVCGNVGGQMNYASDISNWTGVAQSTGAGLREQFFSHVKNVDNDNDHFDLWVREDEKVEKITQSDDRVFTVTTEKGDSFFSRTIVCTSGKKPRTLGIPGEDVAMKGNGLSFSATQDAPLYKDKKMVVIGGGNSAMDVSLQLDKFTDDIVIMTNIDKLIGEGCMMEKINKSPNIDVKYNTIVREVLLDDNSKVRGVRFTEDGGEEQEIECEGIFEEIGQTPATKFLEGFVDLNEQGEIITDRVMNTSRPGFFAGGDCNDGYHKQVIVAAGEGAVAALQAHEYILKN